MFPASKPYKVKKAQKALFAFIQKLGLMCFKNAWWGALEQYMLPHYDKSKTQTSDVIPNDKVG